MLEDELQESMASSSVSVAPYREFLREVEWNLMLETDERVMEVQKQVNNVEKDGREEELDQTNQFKRRRVCKDELQPDEGDNDQELWPRGSPSNSEDAKAKQSVCDICHVVSSKVRACVHCGLYACRNDLFWCSNVENCSFCVCVRCEVSKPEEETVARVEGRWLCPFHRGL